MSHKMIRSKVKCVLQSPPNTLSSFLFRNQNFCVFFFIFFCCSMQHSSLWSWNSSFYISMLNVQCSMKLKKKVYIENMLKNCYEEGGQQTDCFFYLVLIKPRGIVCKCLGRSVSYRSIQFYRKYLLSWLAGSHMQLIH